MSVARRMTVKAALRPLVVCVGLCLMGLAIASPVAFGDGSSALGEMGGSPLESPLLVPEGLSLLGEQAVREAEEARRASPEAVIAREESQTKYEGLGVAAAKKLLGKCSRGWWMIVRVVRRNCRLGTVLGGLLRIMRRWSIFLVASMGWSNRWVLLRRNLRLVGGPR